MVVNRTRTEADELREQLIAELEEVFGPEGEDGR